MVLLPSNHMTVYSEAPPPEPSDSLLRENSHQLDFYNVTYKCPIEHVHVVTSLPSPSHITPKKR